MMSRTTSRTGAVRPNWQATVIAACYGRTKSNPSSLSGTGTKAGGPDYLLHFVEPHVVSENTVRHGLVI